METIYKEIIDRLKIKVPEFRYISADDGQLDTPDENGNYPVFLPAAVIEIENIEWTSTNWPLQSGEGILNIRLAWRNPTRFDSNLTDTQIADAVSRWAIIKKTAKALHGFSGTNFGKLERTRTEREKREGAIKVFVISFAFEGGEDLTPV